MPSNSKNVTEHTVQELSNDSTSKSPPIDEKLSDVPGPARPIRPTSPPIRRMDPINPAIDEDISLFKRIAQEILSSRPNPSELAPPSIEIIDVVFARWYQVTQLGESIRGYLHQQEQWETRDVFVNLLVDIRGERYIFTDTAKRIRAFSKTALSSDIALEDISWQMVDQSLKLKLGMVSHAAIFNTIFLLSQALDSFISDLPHGMKEQQPSMNLYQIEDVVKPQWTNCLMILRLNVEKLEELVPSIWDFDISTRRNSNITSSSSNSSDSTDNYELGISRGRDSDPLEEPQLGPRSIDQIAFEKLLEKRRGQQGQHRENSPIRTAENLDTDDRRSSWSTAYSEEDAEGVRRARSRLRRGSDEVVVIEDFEEYSPPRRARSRSRRGSVEAVILEEYSPRRARSRSISASDEVVVIEEHSPPRRNNSVKRKRRETEYRTVDPLAFGGASGGRKTSNRRGLDQDTMRPIESARAEADEAWRRQQERDDEERRLRREARRKQREKEGRYSEAEETDNKRILPQKELVRSIVDARVHC